MGIEASLFGALKALVGNRVYPDATPDNPVFPLIVYQGVGGKAFEYIEKKLPDHEHERIQIYVWANSRLESNSIMRQARKILIEGALVAQTYGQPVRLYEEDLKLYGSRQDFGFWFKP